jgi:hypothetical protein
LAAKKHIERKQNHNHNQNKQQKNKEIIENEKKNSLEGGDSKEPRRSV